MPVTTIARACAAALVTALVVVPAADAKKKPPKKAKAKTTFTITAGTTTLTLDPTVAGILQAQQIAITPLEPATAPAAGQIAIPVTGGRVDTKRQTATIAHEGAGLSIGGPTLPLAVDVLSPTVTVKGAKGVLRADTLLGTQSPLLDLQSIKFPAKIPKNGKVTVRGVRAIFQQSVAGTLAGLVPGLPQPLPLGTASITLTLK